MRSSHFISLSFVVCLSICHCLPRIARSEQKASAERADQAQEIARACAQAIESVDSFEGRVLLAMREKKLPADSSLTPEGLLVLHDFHVKWERTTGRTRLGGRFFYIMEGEHRSARFQAAYDGREFRTLGEEDQTGQILKPGANLTKYRHMAMLLGHGIIEHPMRDVVQLLENDVKMASEEALKGIDHKGLHVLERPYLHNPGAVNEREMLLRVFVDPKRGALPSRIQCVNQGSGTLHTEVIVQEFLKWNDRVWVPVRGTLQLFDVSIHVPKGYTFNQMVEMSMEERKKIGAVYIPAPIGEPEHIILSTIRVNPRVADEEFILSYPEGARVYDDLRKTSLVAKDGALVPDPRAELNRRDPTPE